IDSALSGLKDAVASGRISVARIDESVRRILQAKAKLGLNNNRFVDVDTLNNSFRRPEFVAAAQDITDRGITLLRNDGHLVPLDATRPQRYLLLSVSGDPEPVPGEEFEREVRWRVDSLQVVRTDTRFNRAENAKLPPPQNYDAAIVALYVRVGDRKGTVG